MKKRILSIALVVAMIVVMIPAMLLPTAAFDYANGYVTAKVNAGAINVDATAEPDAAYLNSEKIVSTEHYDNCNKSGETSSFYGYTATDDLGLYLWVKITDQSFDKGNGYDKVTGTDNETGEDITQHYDMPVGGGDKFQLYIRLGGATSSAARASGSFQIDYLGQISGSSPKYPKNYTNINGEKLDFNPSLVEYKTSIYESDDAWVAEMYIPWTALGGDFATYTSTEQFTEFQIGLQANNMATSEAGAAGDGSAHKAYCYDTIYGSGYYNGMTSDHAYHKSTSTSFQGSHCVPLSFSGFRTAVVNNAPVVDAKFDDAYLKSEIIDDVYVGGGSENFVAYTAATTEGYYVYVDIVDDTLDKAATTVVGDGDKFQIYVQMGNRFSNRDWGYIEMDYRTAEECDPTVADAVNFRFVDKTIDSSGNSGWADNSRITTDMCQYATAKKADGSGWIAEVFIPFAGRMTDANFDDSLGTTMAIALQVNNYTNPYLHANGKVSCDQITYCLSSAWGSGAWYAYTGTSGNASGNFFMTPVVFDFEADNAAEKIVRWAKYTTDDITLDGTMDEAYSELAGEAVDYVYVHSAGITQYPELATEMGWEKSGWKTNFSFVKAYYLFTDTDMYVFLDVEDDSVSLTCNTDKADFAGIFFENSESIAKFALSPFEGGTFITNTTYRGKTVALPASSSAYAENDMIALKLKGTANAYTGYTVEFKLPLTDTEKAALAAGDSVNIGIGIQANDFFEKVNEDGTTTTTRSWYGFNVPYGNLWWQNGGDIIGTFATPKVLLDKTLTEADFAAEPEITSAQVALGESITMNYYANLPLDAAGSAQMKFTFNGEETVAYAATTETANEYVFAFEGIAPQAMGDNIKAELIVGGEVVDTKDNYSVFANCMNLVEAYPTNAELIKLIADLGAYGAAAQLYTGYKTDNLVNKGFEQHATPVDAIEGFEKVLANDSELFYFTAAGVHFANTNKIFAKMYIDAEAKDFVTVTINGKAATLEALGDGMYVVYTDEILVTEFADTFEIVITDKYESSALEYSVNAYCQAKFGNAKNPAAATLAAATYAYGVSALAYAG